MYRLRGDWAYFGGCLKQANHGFHVVHLICLFAFISSTHICLPVNLSICLSIISIYHIYRSYPIIDHIYMYRSIYPTNYRSIDWSIYNRRKFRSETSDNMDSWKAEVRRVRRDKIRRKKRQMREKVGKSRNTVFFQWFGAPEGRKVGSLKRRVRSQLARCEMKKCTPLWREAHLEVKMYKTHQVRTTFGSCDVEKVHAVVARSTFPSQNVQNTRVGPLLEVAMSKKCTPLWREAHFQVKMYKTHHARTTFGSCDVEKVHAVVARSTFPSQNVQNTPCSDHFWRFRCRKSVEKVHAVVARSTFRSQKCKKLRVLSLFWREDVEKVDTD